MLVARPASTVHSVTSVAHDLPAVRPALPSWRATLWAAFLGWFFAFFAIAALGTAAAALGLISRPDGSGLHDWPYPEAGRASLAANVVVWTWILALTALLIRWLLAPEVRRPVSAVTIFFVLALTGFAPFLPHGLLDAPWLVALLVTVALLRLAPVFEPPGVPRRVTIVALAVGLILLAVPVIHAVSHPLWPGTSIVSDQAPNTTTFSLWNAGSADVELEAVSLGPGWLDPLRKGLAVRVDEHPPAPPGAPFDSPRLPFTLQGGSDAFVQLRLRKRICGTGTLFATATVGYRVRGAERVLRVPVPITPRPCDPRIDG